MKSHIAYTAVGPIEYTLRGQGSVLLICHGASSNCFSDELVQPLIKACYSVLTPSRPGYGRTPLEIGRSATQAAQALIELLNFLHIEKCSVIGISGGGPTSMALAAGYPQRVESLIFAAAVSCPEKRLHDPGFKQQLVFYGPTHNLTWCMLGLASRLSPRGAAWQTMAIFSTHNTQESFSELDDWDVEKISRFYRKKSSRRGALNDQSHTVGKELLNAISQPTLVIHSREDRSVPFSHAQWLLENIPQAELCESGFTGHFFWIGPNFTSVCQQMTEFLQISISR